MHPSCYSSGCIHGIHGFYPARRWPFTPILSLLLLLTAVLLVLSCIYLYLPINSEQLHCPIWRKASYCLILPPPCFNMEIVYIELQIKFLVDFFLPLINNPDLWGIRLRSEWNGCIVQWFFLSELLISSAPPELPCTFRFPIQLMRYLFVQVHTHPFDEVVPFS